MTEVDLGRGHPASIVIGGVRGAVMSSLPVARASWRVLDDGWTVHVA
ncbi:hypothetical protein AB0I27_17015 [Streptomyces sp. NPDC050597]